jgi:hypothetical protein
MKPGATATLSAPYYMSVRAYGDPTHKRFIGDWTLFYLSKD